MEAIRKSHRIFMPDQFKKGDNLALRLSKFNSDIDGDKEHTEKDNMLTVMASYQMGKEQYKSYNYAFNHWQQIIQQRNDSISFEIKSTTKSLLGMGNASVHEFGVNLSYPWGVPYLSGTSIKGLLSSYLAKHGGDVWEKSQTDSQKSDLQVELFGGDIKQDNQTKSYIGSVIFNDAWLIPGENPNSQNKWYVPDIINVHYQKYYSGDRFPDGTENPIPIKIAALRPELNFLVSIQGPQDAIKFLLPVLQKALQQDGLGSKTSTGYGRFDFVNDPENIFADKERKQKEARQEQQKQQKLEQALEGKSELAKKIALQRINEEWDTNKNAFIVPGKIETIIEKLEADPQVDAIAIIEEVINLHFKDLLSNPNAKKGKKTKFKPRQISFAVQFLKLKLTLIE